MEINCAPPDVGKYKIQNGKSCYFFVNRNPHPSSSSIKIYLGIVQCSVRPINEIIMIEISKRQKTCHLKNTTRTHCPMYCRCHKLNVANLPHNSRLIEFFLVKINHSVNLVNTCTFPPFPGENEHNSICLFTTCGSFF